MKKIKAGLMLVLALGLVLLGAQAAGAYSFTYSSGGYSSVSHIEPSNDPVTVHFNTSSVTSSYTDADMQGSGYGKTTTIASNSIKVEVSSQASAKYEHDNDSAWNESSTAYPEGDSGVIPGIFFQVTGNAGDPVRINWDWQANISIHDGGPNKVGILSGYPGGYPAPDAAPMSISVNGVNVWEKAPIPFNEHNKEYELNADGWFNVVVGDIIGVNLCTFVNEDFNATPGDLQVSAFNSMQLEAVPVPLPGAVWLLVGGLAALAGLRRRRRS